MGFRLKPLIQLVKAWKFYNNAEIVSFYLELRTTSYADSTTTVSYKKDMRAVLRMLYANQLAAMRDPMGVSGLVPACKTENQRASALSKLEWAVERSTKAIEAEDRGKIDQAFYYWNLVFGNCFPAM
ncbi:hypothetical protein [Chitinophaga rhizosphaerae]|uniref:hypothetical protein n=1 Tax=Chitinophaga rhizosphaerae TaxID=1864947 RepID=UPI000F80D547|nr:hypothetical protein [Chitinophaga rhizosphaerae]